MLVFEEADAVNDRCSASALYLKSALLETEPESFVEIIIKSSSEELVTFRPSLLKIGFPSGPISVFPVHNE